MIADWGGAKPSYTPPEVLDEYRIVRLHGRGSMGYVYLAEDTLLDRPVAVKFIAQRRPDEAARRRFRAEAIALARLSHPNVVAVYRAGEVNGVPYLVTEFVRGKDLSELPIPLPSAQVIAIGAGLARGLAAAHRKGILHRDLKPKNAILADDGAAKLIDFGLAAAVDLIPRSLSEQQAPDVSGVAPAGTKLYMAPEALRGEPATARSDIYALGAVLYELSTGVAHRDTLPPDVDLTTWNAGIAEPAPRRVSGLDPRLASVIARCLAPASVDRFPSADALADALAVLSAGSTLAPAPAGNPYRGLAAFEAEHRALFFGRTTEALAVIDRLREHAIAVITGDSGVGKSSLCRAGIVPRIEGHALADGRRYRAVTLLPGKRPHAALVAALAAAFSLDEDALALDARDEPHALARALRRAVGKDHGALVFVDQAEELITVADREEAQRFTEVLARLPSAPAGVHVLVAVRGDFFTRLATLPGLGDDLARVLYLLRPLSPEGVRDAITRPAQQKGVSFEPSSLVDALAAAAIDTPGGLPLLQFALAQLWEVKKDATVINVELLEALGGVEGALARHADEVIASLRPDVRAAAKHLLLSMVTVDHTRARRTTSEIDADRPARRGAIEAVVKGRLVVAREVEGETVYELAHEALVQGWGSLREWLSEDGELQARRERVEAAAKEWERLQRAPELLLTGRRLTEALGLEPGELSSQAQALVEASRARARREQWRRWGLIAAVLVLVLVVLVGIRLKARHDLEQVIAGHEAQGRSAMEDGKRRKREAEQKRLLAFEQFDAAGSAAGAEARARSNEAERAWKEAIEVSRQVEATLAGASRSFEAGLALDPASAKLRGLIGDVYVERILLADEFHFEERRSELVQQLTFYDESGERRRWLTALPRLSVDSVPAGAEVTLERYEDDAGYRRPSPARVLGRTSIADVELTAGPGSYRLTFRAPGRAEVRLPIVLDRAERVKVAVDLPPSDAVPEGYIYVPPGRFLFGTTAVEGLRRGMLKAQPLHEAHTGGYLIGRTEVTFGEWIQFLRALPPAERVRLTPNTRNRQWGVELSLAPSGEWQLALVLNNERITAREGEPFIIPGRTSRAAQDWRKFPVTAISMDDARAYMAWLDRSGSLRSARFCDEREWERGSRGADDRSFPHGNRLAPDDAAFDETYGRVSRAFGPDEVGSHPASESPFGLQDMTGSVYEWTRSMDATDEALVRSGGWYYDQIANRVDNRTVAEPETHDYAVGLRVFHPALS